MAGTTIVISERRIQAIYKAIEGLFEADTPGKIADERFTKMTDTAKRSKKTAAARS